MFESKKDLAENVRIEKTFGGKMFESIFSAGKCSNPKLFGRKMFKSNKCFVVKCSNLNFWREMFQWKIFWWKMFESKRFSDKMFESKGFGGKMFKSKKDLVVKCSKRKDFGGKMLESKS